MPKTTLFPYTTLFRSRDAEPARRALEEEFSAELANHIVDEVRVEKELSAIAVVGDNMRQIPGIAGRAFQALGRNGDRKSTRLNSSHVAISYAVFCLKN